MAASRRRKSTISTWEAAQVQSKLSNHCISNCSIFTHTFSTLQFWHSYRHFFYQNVLFFFPKFIKLQRIEITCIELLRLSQGIFSVASSHITTPKLYTSDLQLFQVQDSKKGKIGKLISWIPLMLKISIIKHTSHLKVHYEELPGPSIEATQEESN